MARINLHRDLLDRTYLKRIINLLNNSRERMPLLVKRKKLFPVSTPRLNLFDRSFTQQLSQDTAPCYLTQLGYDER